MPLPRTDGVLEHVRLAPPRIPVRRPYYQFCLPVAGSNFGSAAPVTGSNLEPVCSISPQFCAPVSGSNFGSGAPVAGSNL